MPKPKDADRDSCASHCSSANELFIVATTWAIGAGLGQLVLVPFGGGNWALCLGLVLGATTQSAVYFYRKTGPIVR